MGWGAGGGGEGWGPEHSFGGRFFGEAGGTWDFSRAVSTACGLMAEAGRAKEGTYAPGGPAARDRVLGSGQELGHNPAGQRNRGARGVLAALFPGKKGDPPGAAGRAIPGVPREGDRAGKTLGRAAKQLPMTTR